MKLSDKVTVPSHVMPRTVGDETVILDLANGSYFGLDVVGGRIFELLASDQTLADVCETMLAEFEVSREDIEKDVLTLAQQLIDKQLASVEA
jgi:hypothetical protein